MRKELGSEQFKTDLLNHCEGDEPTKAMPEGHTGIGDLKQYDVKNDD